MKKLRIMLGVVLSLCIVSSLAGASSIVNRAESAAPGPEETAAQLSHLLDQYPDTFGGMYIDEQGQLVINIAADIIPMELQASIDAYEQMIRYDTVKYPLSTLESVHAALIPYMSEFHIAALDANDKTNMVDIELFDEAYLDDLNKLIAPLIDLDAIHITILPQDVTFEFTVGGLDDLNSKDEAKETPSPYHT